MKANSPQPGPAADDRISERVIVAPTTAPACGGGFAREIRVEGQDGDPAAGRTQRRLSVGVRIEDLDVLDRGRHAIAARSRHDSHRVPRPTGQVVDREPTKHDTVAERKHVPWRVRDHDERLVRLSRPQPCGQLRLVELHDAFPFQGDAVGNDERLVDVIGAGTDQDPAACVLGQARPRAPRSW